MYIHGNDVPFAMFPMNMVIGTINESPALRVDSPSAS